MYLYIYLDWIITLYSKVYFHILRLNCLMLPPSWYRRVQVARHWRSTMCIIGWWAVPKCHELFSQCLYDLGPFSAVIYIIYIYILRPYTHYTPCCAITPFTSALGPSPHHWYPLMVVQTFTAFFTLDVIVRIIVLKRKFWKAADVSGEQCLVVCQEWWSPWDADAV